MNITTIPIIMLSILFILGCDKLSTTRDMDSKDVKLIGIELVGCNLGDPVELKKLKNVEKASSADIVIVSYSGDTTIKFVNLNFICSWQFKSAYELENDTLNLTIIDNCNSNSECGAYCMCDYGFYFKFTDIRDKEITCVANFKTDRPEGPRIIGINKID